MQETFKNIVSFIREIYHEPDALIPLHVPVFRGNEKKYLNECIDSTFVSSVGEYVDLFEKQIAQFTGAKKAVACVNGTNALFLALKMVGVESNTEVITQPLTFIATANAIAYTGADPIFLDVDKETMGLSPTSLENWLNNSTVQQFNNAKNESECINRLTGKHISACVPIHTFGHPCRIDEIAQICERFNIPLVEDAAESLGSFYKNQHTGTFGAVGILSFNGNKILTTGGGGMLLFMDEEMGKRAKHLTTQAKVPHPWEFVHDAIGYNYRMPNINAALGVAQLEFLNEFIDNKRNTAETYDAFFKSISISFFHEPKYARSNYWLNTVLLKDKGARDDFLNYTNKQGIMTRPAWCLMNKLIMFKNCQHSKLPNSEWIEERIINIPSSVNIKHNLKK